MGQPLVSVVIASYDMGRFIAQAIESVLAQTYPNLELLVIDDGYRDDTREVVQRYAADGRLHYHWQANAGQTVAKNVGIRAAKGQFIGFCYADDQWLPHKLARQVPVLEANPQVAVVYSKVQYLFDNPRARTDPPAVACPSGKVTEDLFQYNFVPFGTALVRKSALDRTGAFDERYRMGIDWELWLRISLDYDFVFIDEPTYIYRIWEGQMSNNWHGRYEQCFRIMRDFESRHPGAVSSRCRNEAWAHSYVSRARIRSYQSRQHLAAFGDLLRALRFKPVDAVVLRTLARVMANAVGLRAP